MRYHGGMLDGSLIAQVARELRLAGLQAAAFEEPQMGGFGIQPAEGKVYVVWIPSNSLSESAFQALARGDGAHPAVLHVGLVKHAMADAILRILVADGMNARISSDDMLPATVERISRPSDFAPIRRTCCSQAG